MFSRVPPRVPNMIFAKKHLSLHIFLNYDFTEEKRGNMKSVY